MRRLPLLAAAAAAAALAAAGAASPAAKGRCLQPADWQRLADRVHAPVYCPGWMPDPLDGDLGGRWNNIDSVDPDRSYLVGFVWQEVGSGELHVNLRAYPGRTRLPTCIESSDARGAPKRRIPCFSDPRGVRRGPGGIRATLYTVNQDADQWHVLYAWRHGGSLYTLSQHVAPPLSYRQVLASLDRMLARLVLLEPRG